MKFFETHCHLDSLKSRPLPEILQKSLESGVEKIITIAVEPSHLDEVIELSTRYPYVYTTQGIHPHEAMFFTEEIERKIRENVKLHAGKKVVAIGEIGLDYHYDHSPRERQREVFEAQLQIAVDSDLPVVIHTREADEDAAAILKNFSPLLKRKGVLHSFTSGRALAELAIAEGFSLGFNGIITFKNAHEVREVLKSVPLGQILFETDAPYLTPVPHRGKENSPEYLPLVAHGAAVVWNKSGEEERSEFFNKIWQNSLNLFQISQS